MTAFALIFTMAAIGVAITTYLIQKRRAEEVPVCFIGQGCHEVLSSKYNKTFGIHNDLLGLVYYVFESFLVALLVLEVGPLGILETIATVSILIGAGMSVYFTSLQAFVLKTWCFWCLMSALTTWVMAATILLK